MMSDTLEDIDTGSLLFGPNLINEHELLIDTLREETELYNMFPSLQDATSLIEAPQSQPQTQAEAPTVSTIKEESNVVVIDDDRG